tara:strand:+ start:17837 stop:19858 length:2022 start_codon:yes stop_codon:yes gene_type:complete
MEVNETIRKFIEFIEQDKQKLAKLNSSKTMGRNYFIVSFRDLLRFDFEFAEELLENPTDFIKALEIGVRELNNKLPHNFSIRIKDTPKSIKIPINELRSKHIDQLITIEGVVKRKSDVKAQIIKATFQCPDCAAEINILQLEEKKFVEPSKCKCGRKKGFKLTSKEEVNVFSMVVEETTDFLSGGTKLSQIKVLCKAELATTEIERMVYQGIRTDITGILKDIQIRGPRGELTNKIDWYLEANYIKSYDESFCRITWDKSDVDKFEELAKKPDWLKLLRDSIFFDIYGYNEECEGVLLQMFGGVGADSDGAMVRGVFHILLIGDAGSAKSTILKIAQNFAPKAQYVAGTGITGSGITACVVKDELLGGWTLEAGALVLNSGGMVCLDELDKMNDENKKSLHEPMEQCTVSISKANIQATMVAKTSLLAAANPKHGNYSDHDSIYEQLDLSNTLISRFDFVYPIQESVLTKEDHKHIARKIVTRRNKKAPTPYDREFIRKYIAYSYTIEPETTPEIEDYIVDRYSHLKEKRNNAAEFKDSAIAPVTARVADAFRRIAEAVARSRLHKKITKEDAQLAYQKIVYSLQQMGIDPDSGEVVIETIDNKKIKQKDVMARICKVIREMSAKEPVDRETVVTILEEEGMGDRLHIEEMIDKLAKQGHILEPRVNKLKFNV